MRHASARVTAGIALAVSLAGCPKPKVILPPPPVVAAGPAQVQLARRDLALATVRASAVIRMRIPQGMEGAPGGKVHADVLAAARPDRARLEILTPLGTPGATVLLAGGMLQVYQPYSNELLKAPLDSPDLATRSPFPVPMAALPSLLRGVVPIGDGEVTETPVAAAGSAGEMTIVEVKGPGGDVRQRITVDKTGGYPIEDIRFEAGVPTLTVRYLDYGAVTTPAGPIAFPQHVTATVVRPDGTATLEIALSDIELGPALPDDAFTLAFDRDHPPRLQEIH